MNGHLRGLLCAAATTALVAGVTTPAHAAKPPWAGPPEVETVPIVGSGPPSFLCDGREVVFTGGDVTFRFRMLPKDRVLGIIKVRDATASDGRTNYRVTGVGKVMASPTQGSFSLRFTFIGPKGKVERVNSTASYRGGQETLVERGTCTVVD